jgi:hypothetical protein
MLFGPSHDVELPSIRGDAWRSGRPPGSARMSPPILFAAMFLLGLVSMGLCLAFVKACEII